MSKAPKSPDQTALFGTPILDIQPFKKAMKEALRACPLSRDQVADRMSLFLGKRVSKDMINAWTAPTKPDHLPRADEMIAFVYATLQPEPLNQVAVLAEFYVIDRKDYELLRLAKLKEERAALDEEIEQMEALRRAPERKRHEGP